MTGASEQSVLNAQWNAAVEAQCTAMAARAPHVLMRPSLGPDGNKWSVLYGDNIMEGVAGYGDTPEEAMADFDKNWSSQTLPARCRDCGRAVDDDGYTTDPHGCCITCKVD